MKRFMVIEEIETEYGGKSTTHMIDAENTTEARHWAINHLDMSNNITIKEYK